MSAATPWSVYLGKQTPVEQEPDTGQTFVLPDALRDGGHVESSFLRRIIDWDALDYLSGTIRDLMPKQSKLAQASYVPLKATGRLSLCLLMSLWFPTFLRGTGDGNCLLHAVSRAIWGIESYHEMLRSQMEMELITHLDWYIMTTKFFLSAVQVQDHRRH
jgi:hypothetical protein